jgi:hypothetical protein
MIAETVLWEARRLPSVARCSVRSECAGVELTICEGDVIARRERYADRSTAFERARELRAAFEREGYVLTGESGRAS